MKPFRFARPGTTLVELILFLGIFAVIGSLVLPILFASTETRLLQQTISIVEHNGTQLLQNVGYRIRMAERVLDPLPNGTGSVLALQTSSGAINPVIIGVNSGSLVVIRHTIKQVLSSPQVSIQNFVVRNTSASSGDYSVEVSFIASRTIRLQSPRTYRKIFKAAFTLFPIDNPKGNPCECGEPQCIGNNNYSWEVCEGECLSATTYLEC